MFIYLDESGDLGFDFRKQKTTKKFVITLLVCQSQNTVKEFERAIRRTVRNKINKGKSKPRRIIELKGINTGLKIKKYFLKQIKVSDWQLYTVVLNKSRVNSALRGKRDKLYNFLARFIIEKLPLGEVSANVKLVVDRSKNREEIRDFNHYVENYIQGHLPLNTGFNVEHLTSQENPVLQAVDLLCWGIARKYERNDTKWYNEFRSKIRYETEYLR